MNSPLTTYGQMLARFGLVVVALELLVLTPIAVVVNLPTQFGVVGTDAGSEFITRGTAISAPLLVLLVLGALSFTLLRARRRRAPLIAGIGLVGALFLIGALGEALAEPTADVPRGVLVATGIGVGALAAVMIALAAAAAVEHRRRWRARTQAIAWSAEER